MQEKGRKVIKMIKDKVASKHEIKLNNKEDIDKFVNGITQYIGDFFEGLAAKHSLQYFLETLEKIIDKIIIDSCKNEGLVYYGGNLTVTYREKNIDIDIECYFKNPYDKWIKKQINKSVLSSGFTEESTEELIKEGQLKFEIKNPIQE